MSQYFTLPIYKSSYELSIMIAKLTSTFPRNYRYSLGKNLFDETQNLINLIMKINSEKERLEDFEKFGVDINSITIKLRISKDLRLISVKQYSSAVEIIAEIRKHHKSWSNYFKKKKSC